MAGAEPLPSWAVEESAEELYEDAPCGYLSTAADGTVVRVNQTLLRWLGRRREDVVGRVRFADLVAAGPRVVWLTHHVPRLAADGELSGVLLELLRDDGSALPVLLGVRLVAAAETPALVRITVFDATERQEYERQLRAMRRAAERAEGRARALQQVTHACAASSTGDELVAAVVPAVARALDLDGCALRLGESADRLRTVAEVGAGRALTGPVPAACWLDRRVVTTTLARGAASRAGWADGAVVHVPVQEAGRPLGALCLLRSPSVPLDAEDVAVLETMGELLGLALTRTWLHDDLQRLALHDGLTGLANRAALAEVLGQAIARSDRTGVPLGALLIDLDGFKQVNDTFGHAAGDALLVAVAERLRGAVRDADRLARLGGDEFVVVGEDLDGPAADALAGRVTDRLSRPFALPGGTAEVSASIGVAVREPGSGLEADDLLARADAAMYERKRARGSRPPR